MRLESLVGLACDSLGYQGERLGHVQQKCIARRHLGKRPPVTLEMGGEELLNAADLGAARSGKARGMGQKER